MGLVSVSELADLRSYVLDRCDRRKLVMLHEREIGLTTVTLEHARHDRTARALGFMMMDALLTLKREDLDTLRITSQMLVR